MLNGPNGTHLLPCLAKHAHNALPLHIFAKSEQVSPEGPEILRSWILHPAPRKRLCASQSSIVWNRSGVVVVAAVLVGGSELLCKAIILFTSRCMYKEWQGEDGNVREMSNACGPCPVYFTGWNVHSREEGADQGDGSGARSHLLMTLNKSVELHATSQTGCKWKGAAENDGKTGEGDRHRFLRSKRDGGETWEIQKRFWVSEKRANRLRSAQASALAARGVSERVNAEQKDDERRNGRGGMEVTAWRGRADRPTAAPR